MANPLKLAGETVTARRSPQEWCDIGNARLRGETPYKDGQFHPRSDIHWVVRDGRCVLEWRR
jgi:hypothetical protein